MENTMTSTAHQPVGFAGAVKRQFGLLWTSRRPLLLGIALLAVLALAGEPWSDDPTARLLAPWPIWLVLVGPVWAFAIFHNEGPSNRLYHWAAPVDRTLHTTARLTAGLLWLWLLYLGLVAVGVIMAGLDGNLAQLGQVGPSAWINLFTGPLLGYLLISFLTVASDYPIRWFFGIFFAVPFLLSLLDEWLGLEDLVEILLRPLAAEGWGLFFVMVGRLGEEAMHISARLQGSEGWDPPFTVTHWWPATVAWIVLLGLILVLLASRHPDRLPRLRRRG